MNAYEILSAGDLLDFAEAIQYSLNKQGGRMAFYRNLEAEMDKLICIHQQYDTAEGYCIYRGVLCNAMYLANYWRIKGSARENRVELERICKEISEKITRPKGIQITEEYIQQVFSYLNQKLNFSSNICNGKPINILLPQNTHRDYNGACVTHTDGGKDRYTIELYHLNDGVVKSPEFILFHELGHVLQMSLTESVDIVPKTFAEMVEKYANIEARACNELFADMFAIIVMKDSPFEVSIPKAFIST